MKKLLLALALFLLPISAEAATCFWVGGTGSWSTANTASWASSTGGTTGTCAATGGVPKQSADVATFDGASGGGTVTVDSTMNGVSLNSIAAGAFTGTLDFSVNNPSMTFTSTGTAIGFSGAGTGRIFKLGSGTFTISDRGSFDFGTTTGAGTQSLASATIVMGSTAVAGQQAFNGGGFAYGTLTINGRATGQGAVIQQINTFTTLNLNGPLFLNIATGQTITNLNISGSASNYVFLPEATTQSTTGALAVTNAAIDHAIIRGVIFSGASPIATNSIDMGNNNMNGGSITPPAPAGGGHIIGG